MLAVQDAGAGGITGLLEGSVYHLGDFDECMDVLGPVGAQYCIAEVRIHAPNRTSDHRHHPDSAPDPMQSVWNRVKVFTFRSQPSEAGCHRLKDGSKIDPLPEALLLFSRHREVCQQQELFPVIPGPE